MSLDKIGRYELEGELGHRGMSTVYLAHDPFMNRRVAIKVLSCKLVADEMFHDHFQREAEVIASLEHPSIVPIFDFGWHGDQPYIVMRYMNGGIFQERIEGNKIRLTNLARILSRVAEGLDAAHRKGVIHRDVKLSNILFDNTNQAFLSDFGMAKEPEERNATAVEFAQEVSEVASGRWYLRKIMED